MQDYETLILAEAALGKAMLGGDVAALDDLLDDDVRFTDQSGRRLSKDEDLAGHRSGLLRIETLEPVGAPDVRICGDCALVWVTVDLAGFYKDEAFFGRFAYSRIWQKQSGQWRVVLAHCSAVPDDG